MLHLRSEQVSSFDICGETLPMYCRVAADVRVWRRVSVAVDVVVNHCRPDVEGGPIFRPKNLLKRTVR